MPELKIVVNDVKTGKTYQKAVENTVLIGRKLGENIKGDDLGLKGYELEISGGSDKAGFAMRKDVPSGERKRILAVKGVGLKNKIKGKRIRKTVRGRNITENTAQVNLKVLNYGTKGVPESLGIETKEETPKEEKPPEAKKEEASKEKAPEKSEVKKEKKEEPNKNVKEEKKAAEPEKKDEEKVQKEEIKE